MNYTQPRLVYFIKPVGMDGPIKIGCSSVPAKRLEDLSVWSPFPLEVIATAPGSYKVEQALHQRFAFLHSHREWFHANPELTVAIRRIASGVPIEKAVDLSLVTGSIRKSGKGGRPVPEYRKGHRSYSARVRWAQKKVRKLGEDTAWHAPDDVCEIMHRWNGNPYHGIEGVRPTAEQFKRLDEYLADPAAHSVIPKWRRKDRAA